MSAAPVEFRVGNSVFTYQSGKMVETPAPDPVPDGLYEGVQVLGGHVTKSPTTRPERVRFDYSRNPEPIEFQDVTGDPANLFVYKTSLMASLDVQVGLDFYQRGTGSIVDPLKLLLNAPRIKLAMLTGAYIYRQGWGFSGGLVTHMPTRPVTSVYNASPDVINFELLPDGRIRIEVIGAETGGGDTSLGEPSMLRRLFCESSNATITAAVQMSDSGKYYITSTGSVEGLRYVVRPTNPYYSFAEAAAFLELLELDEQSCLDGGTELPRDAYDLPAGFAADQVGPVTFTENFNGPLDPAVWTGQQWFQDEDNRDNFSIADGELKIWNVQRNGEWDGGREFTTDGPPSTTVPKFEQMYGFFEVVASVPFGPSNWPAFWGLTRKGVGRGEIDFAEFFAGDGYYTTDDGGRLVNYAGTVWGGETGNPIRHGKVDAIAGGLRDLDLSGVFHRYGCKWDRTGAEFYIDGVSIGKVYHDIATPLFLIISMGTQANEDYEGLTHREPDSRSSLDASNAFRVRSIRAWGLPDNSHATGGSTII